jgi:hypothetical protein
MNKLRFFISAPGFFMLLVAGSFITSGLVADPAPIVKEGPEHRDPLPVNPASPVPTEARRMALESADAFTNDGFRVRDAEWPFSLNKATPAFLAVTLFNGNRYWFVTATPTPGVKLRVTIYDSSGHPVKSEQWQDTGEHGGSRAAAGIAPDTSGNYFVSVELLENPSDQQLDCSLVSAYK